MSAFLLARSETTRAFARDVGRPSTSNACTVEPRVHVAPERMPCVTTRHDRGLRGAFRVSRTLERLDRARELIALPTDEPECRPGGEQQSWFRLLTFR